MKNNSGSGSLKGKKRQAGSGKTEPKKGDYLSFRLVAIIFLSLVVVGGLFYYVENGGFSGGGGIQSVANASITPVTNGNEVTFPASAFADGKARFFEYKMATGKKIRYFVIKSSDGVIRAAYDACDVCWPEGKGYHQEGDYMVCNNCGRRFQSTKVNVITGGCNPGALTRAMRDDKVVITLAALDEGSRYFK